MSKRDKALSRQPRQREAAAEAPEPRTSVRERIIECATDLLGRKGYGALSVSAVCKLADVSAPSLYWHFGNKEGLLAELLKHALRRDADAFLAIDIAGISRFDAFELYLAALRKMVVTDRPNNWVILSSLSEARHAAPEIVDIIAEARRRQVEYNAEQLRLWGMRNDRKLVHLWLSFCNYLSLLYQDTKSEALVDEAIVSFQHVYFLTLAALGEDCAQEEEFRSFLQQAGYQPGLFQPVENGLPPDRPRDGQRKLGIVK
jgi:AcrR family transcriptional regulator